MLLQPACRHKFRHSAQIHFKIRWIFLFEFQTSHNTVNLLKIGKMVFNWLTVFRV